MLQWTPFYIKGKFVHGNLEGPVRIVTTNNNIIFATFKNGVMHGPVVSYGLSLILKDKYKAKGLFPNHLQLFIILEHISKEFSRMVKPLDISGFKC